MNCDTSPFQLQPPHSTLTASTDSTEHYKPLRLTYLSNFIFYRSDLSVKSVSSVSSTGVSLSERVTTLTTTETRSSSSVQTFEMVSTVTTATVSEQSIDVQLQMTSVEEFTKSPALILKMKDLLVSPGDMAQFSCSFDGQPLTEIAWDHNGRTLTNTERVQCMHHEDVLSLVILNVQLADQGRYCCTVKNRNGENHTSAQLAVEGGYRFYFLF